MGYNALINSNLKQAYNLVKDLAVVGVFTKINSSTFNFATSTATTTTEATITTKVIVIGNTTTSGDSTVIKKEIMVKTLDVGDVKLYDTVTIAGEVWKVGQIIRDSGYITIFEAVKGD